MNAALSHQLPTLCPVERIQLTEDLRDSVMTKPAALPTLGVAQCNQIGRNLQEQTKSPASALSWNTVRRQLSARLV